MFSNLTVLENLELALKEQRGVFRSLVARLSRDQKGRIDEVLELIDLADSASRRAGLLSHGQKQWLEIGMLVVHVLITTDTTTACRWVRLLQLCIKEFVQ